MNDEELEATKKLNGVAKENNREEDIKKLNRLIEGCKECKFAACEQCEINWTEVQAIEHILAEREEDKKRIEELEVLKDDLKDKRIVYVDTPEFAENYIPKQKVKEELEKAKKENEPYEIHNKESRMFWINQGKIRLAKKLLEDK